MFENILFIDILNENGLTRFNNDENMLNNITTDANIELAFLDDYNDLNELTEYIENSDYDTIIFKFKMSKGLFAEKLTREVVKRTEKEVIWICEQLNKSYSMVLKNKCVYIFNSFTTLNEFLSEAKLNLDPIELKKIKKTFLENNEYPGLYKTAMSNGYFSYVTGVYNFFDADLSLKHIKTDNSIDLFEVLNNLDININSAFFIESDDYKLDIYEDVNKTDKFVSHFHQITKDKIYLDNSGYSIESVDCSFEEYVNLCKKNNLDENKIYVTSLSSKNDIDKFKQELIEFGHSGKMLPPQFYLKDECRWSGKCGVSMSKRLNIVAGKLRLCNDSDTYIYDINDDNFTKLAKINRKKDRTEMERKCLECNYKKSCSKCICLPISMNEQNFCEFISNYPYVAEYIYKKNFKLFLLMNSTKFAKTIEDLQFSSQACPILYKERTKKYDVSKMIYLFKYDDKYYIYSLKSNQIIKIDEKLAFILEGYSQSRQESDIILKFKEKYDIDDICAKNTVEKGSLMLKNIGIKA